MSQRDLTKSMDTLFPKPYEDEKIVCPGCGHEHHVLWKRLRAILQRLDEGCEECGADLSRSDLEFEEADRCRVCGEEVVDGRWSYCSERCRDIANAVQRMFIWGTVRERVLERDDYTCQNCGASRARRRRARRQVQEIIRKRTQPLRDREEWDRWRRAQRHLRERYDMPSGHREFQVDHIEPVSKGGHKFDERNLQTLCRSCHHEKTAEENRHGDTEPPEERHITLDTYIGGTPEADGGGGGAE